MIANVRAGTLRVLVVDDHQALRTVLVRLLTKASDIEVLDAAESGEQALDLAQKRTPDVVVMDVSMPGIGGIEATRRLKAALPRCRVVGHSSMEDAEAMRAAGAEDFVHKGAPLKRLLEAIKGT